MTRYPLPETKVNSTNEYDSFANKRAELDREATSIRTALDTAIRTKSFGNINELERRVKKLGEDRKEIDRQEAAITTGKFAALRAYGGGSSGNPVGFGWGVRMTRQPARDSGNGPGARALSAREAAGTVPCVPRRDCLQR
jgi:hypothetical protein